MDKGEDISDRLRRIMAEKGMIPADLARRAQVSQPTVHGWLHKGHGLSRKNLHKVAKVLGIPANVLMFGENEAEEAIAHTRMELLFLQQFRGLDDAGQMDVLRYITETLPNKTSSLPLVTKLKSVVRRGN